MDILNPKDLRQQARTALRRGREPKKLIYTYAGITLAVSIIVFLANLWLNQQIEGTGGLGNLGTRAIFETVKQVLPIASSIISMCLNLGFLGGLLRISRGQYAYIGPVDGAVCEGDTLKLGQKVYLFRRVELYYYENQPIYQWGLCVEKGVNDTWGIPS